MKKLIFGLVFLVFLIFSHNILATNSPIKLKVGESFLLEEGLVNVVSNDNKIEVSKKDNRFQIVAKEYGQALISLYYNDKTINKTIYIFDTLQFNSRQIYLNVGEKQQIYMIFQPFAQIKNPQINYRSSNELVAAVENGYVVAYQPGKTIIEGEFLGIYDQVEVTVSKKSNFYFDQSSFNIILNDKKILPFHNEGIDKIQFSSECSDKILVDNIGMIEAKELAECFIVGKSGNDVDRIFVRVNSPLNDFEFNDTNYSLALGEKLDFKLLPIPETANIIEPKIVIDNTDIVEYKNNQLISKGVGSTLISAIVNGIEKSAKVEVYLPLKNIVIEPKNINLSVGERLNLNVLKVPYNSNEQLTPIYSSSNPDVIKVDAFGNIIAVNAGRAVVFVQHKNFIASSEIIVHESNKNISTLVGKLSDNKIIFDTRGIDYLSKYSLKIPYSEELLKNKIIVILPIDSKIRERLFKEVILSDEYLNKSVVVEFKDENDIFLNQVNLVDIDSIDNIYVDYKLVPSPFTNLKQNIVELDIFYNIKKDDNLVLKLYNNSCSGSYYIYKKSLWGNNAELYDQNKLQVDSSCLIRLSNLRSGKFYLSRESIVNVIEGLLIGSLVLLLASIIFFIKKYYDKKSRVVEVIKKERKNESVNYQAVEVHKHDF